MLSSIVFLHDSEYTCLNELYSHMNERTIENMQYSVPFYSEGEVVLSALDKKKTVLISFSDIKYDFPNILRVSYFDTKNSSLLNADSPWFFGYSLFIGSKQVTFPILKFVNKSPKKLVNLYDSVQNKGIINCGVHNNINLSVILSKLSDEIKTKVNFVPLSSLTELQNSIESLHCYMLTSFDLNDYILMNQCGMNNLLLCNSKKSKQEYPPTLSIYEITDLLIGKERNKFLTSIFSKSHSEIALTDFEELTQYIVRMYV